MRAFEIHVADGALADLRDRLARTRWPDEDAAVGWSWGTAPSYARELAAYWQEGFDWRAQEARLNAFPQVRVTVEGVGIHAVHVPGTGPDPLPLVLTHGWPSTFAEFQKVVPLLTDPGSHGGDPADAFHVVVPSLPGYAFSDRPADPWFSRRIPALWVGLMDELGYPRFAAHGDDVGTSVTSLLGLWHPDRVVGIHVTYPSEPYIGPGSPPLTAGEETFLAERRFGQEEGGAYAHVQRTRPVTLAYGLNDSPTGLMSWIVEKWRAWSDCDGNVESRFTKDELLTNVSLYWLTETIGSSLRVYRDLALGAESNPAAWEGRDLIPGGVASKPLGPSERIAVPAAVTLFGDMTIGIPDEWVARTYPELRSLRRMPRGGHFPAMEEPDLLVEALRAAFRPLRPGWRGERARG